jgi:hypothetical protein
VKGVRFKVGRIKIEGEKVGKSRRRFEFGRKKDGLTAYGSRRTVEEN